MLAAREKLRPLLEGKSGNTWRSDEKYFRSGEGPQGLVNLSPAWFPCGYDVSASAHEIHFSAAHPELGNGATVPEGF